MKVPLLSIVVPVVDEIAVLEDALTALRSLRREGAELIVVDGGSTDGTVEWLEEARGRRLLDRWLTADRGRALQMNAGAAVARGPWLLFLHADTRLPASASQWLRQLPEQSADWGFFPVRLDGAHPLLRVVERGIEWRSRFTGVATGDQAIFVRRERFDAIGGYPGLPLMEDVALSKRLKGLSRPQVWGRPVTTSARRWERRGILRTVLQMWWLRWLFFCGVSPDHLVRRYYGPG